MMASYWLLFWSALLAATLIPAQSELVLSGLIIATPEQVIALVIVATLGNTLGSVINWSLGRYIEYFQDRRWFPFKPSTIAKSQATFQRYGGWILLFGWVPVVGDPLTLVAGLLRMPLWKFIILVFIAKGARYMILAGLVLQGIN
jgi:membrane protein YqaA with SNARE-associated domain